MMKIKDAYNFLVEASAYSELSKMDETFGRRFNEACEVLKPVIDMKSPIRNERCDICTNKDSALCSNCIYGVAPENHFSPIYHTYYCTNCGIRFDSDRTDHECCPQCGHKTLKEEC